MAVIPTYSTGIGAPDLAGAFLGGRRIRLSREQIAQQAASDAARIQLGREQLAQQAVQNEMELAAKKEVLANESLRRAQEQEIEKSYRQTQIGLKERELKQQELMDSLKIQEAARSFAAQQEYQRRVAAGEPPEEVMRQVGFGLPGFPAAFETIGRGSRLGEMDRMRLSSDIQRIDREMTEQRDVLDNLHKLPKDERIFRENQARRRLRQLEKNRSDLFGSQQSPPELNSGMSAPVTAGSPAWQGPMQARTFMGTPTGEDASGFPTSVIQPPAWQGPTVSQMQPPEPPVWQGPMVGGTPFTISGRGGQTTTGLDFSAPSTVSNRVRVEGPNGERGTVDANEPLPKGWKKIQ